MTSRQECYWNRPTFSIAEQIAGWSFRCAVRLLSPRGNLGGRGDHSPGFCIDSGNWPTSRTPVLCIRWLPIASNPNLAGVNDCPALHVPFARRLHLPLSRRVPSWRASACSSLPPVSAAGFTGSLESQCASAQLLAPGFSLAFWNCLTRCEHPSKIRVIHVAHVAPISRHALYGSRRAAKGP